MTTSKIALVTGASQGIGAATAHALAQAGYTVVLAARRLDALDKTIVGFGDVGKNCSGVSCDVTDPDSVDALFAEIKNEHSHLDVVFNNAGNNVGAQLIGDTSFDDWRHVMSVNADGAFLVARGAFRVMRDQSPQGGRIINNGSISAHTPRFGSTAYTASKHTVEGLTKCVSLDGRAFNIACGQIDIGNAASAMTSKMSGGVPQADGSLKSEPVIDVKHVADTVVYMANLPLDVNVQTMTIMATAMPYVGRG